MGDIARHRDIFLFTRDVVPPELLRRNRLDPAAMTYLELGNFLTDVSQFRDPVTFIFTKQRVWRDLVVPKVSDKVMLARLLTAAAAVATAAASRFLSGTASDVTTVLAAAAGTIAAGVPSDLLAAIAGADEWIDAMFGTPLERTPVDARQRDDKHYGALGQFFRHFIEGVTHLLFAEDVRERGHGGWGRIDPIPEAAVTEVFTEFFTQYYPHEHTDQPPYVWDASRRPGHPMYRPSRRGVMNAVDVHYIRYLAEELTDVEERWRAVEPGDAAGRARILVRMGKLLHGIEDWFFHSNVAEILLARGHTPRQGTTEDDEQFLRRLVTEVAGAEPEFVAADATERLRLQRKLFRRLRFPAYERGTGNQCAGRLSTTTMSTPSLRHAYPAFPSQQDTAHTLLHALENLEHKLVHAGQGRPVTQLLTYGLPDWVPCVLRRFVEAAGGEGRTLVAQKASARGVGLAEVVTALASTGPQRTRVHAAIVDVLREWVPLVVTLLDESERRRLAADVPAADWPPLDTGSLSKRTPGTAQLDLQLELHRAALEPRATDDGLVENNYERAVRYLAECGFLNVRGRQAIVRAFEVDRAAEQLRDDAPGCGGILITFAVDLQKVLDAGDAASEKLNQDRDSVFGRKSDNGAFNEVVGSHSLLAKDTVTSTPFFDDTRVMASVASSSVLTVMLEQVSVPTAERRLVWAAVLRHLIRFPPAYGGWERRAIRLFRENGGKIPAYADLPELARMVASARRPSAAPARDRRSKRVELEQLYVRLEAELSQYRYRRG